MKMKIIIHKFFLFITLITLIFQPVFSITMRLTNENNFSNSNKKQDFYNESFRHEDYESPRIIRHQTNDWNNSEQNSEMNNSNLNLNSQTFNHNTSPIMRGNNNNNINNIQARQQAAMMQQMQNTAMNLEGCPCISRVKCQPCGIAPILDFSRSSSMDCPCAPKPSCPVCPPLSLIHEIASKKVFINLNRPNKINN